MLTFKAFNHNVLKMMDDFTATLTQIELKGGTFTKQLMCLFKAFETSHDHMFKNYIQSFKDTWEDGDELDWTTLLDRVGEKCKSLHEAGTWKDKDAHKQQIIALTAALEKAVRFAPTTPRSPKSEKIKSPM